MLCRKNGLGCVILRCAQDDTSETVFHVILSESDTACDAGSA